MTSSAPDHPDMEPETWTPSVKSGAYLVGLNDGMFTPFEIREHLAELRGLVEALGIPCVGETTVMMRQPNPKFYVGSGKAEEIHQAAEAVHAECVVFDMELGPSQQRNLERLCGRSVIDRQEVILDIFAGRAKTKEAVLQVELARHKYFLPRLTKAWSHLSRQRGGANGTRGEGEKQIETDRRLVRAKITQMEAELAEVRKQRVEQRKSRIRHRIPTAAIVGYTNAGKSSLLNRLTGAKAFVKDQLFATLDPTTRRLELPNRTPLLLTDTVGFVRKLPHTLVEAFKSTLEEAVLADFLVMVLDVSNPDVESHRETTLSVLNELGAQDKPILMVYNKVDRQNDPAVRARIRSVTPDAVFVSCETGEGLARLVEAFQNYAEKCSSILELELPPERSDLTAMLYAKGTVLEGHYGENGTFHCAARIPESILESYQTYINTNGVKK